MNINDYIQGDDVMLYINTDAGYIPVACITSMPLERTTDRIETTVRGDEGNKSYMPGYHDYTLSVSGVISKADGVISYDGLDKLQENRVVFDWKIQSSDGYIAKSGTAFITNLSLNSDAGSWVTFGCTLSPSHGGLANILVWSQDGLNVVEDGTGKVITIN